MSLKVLSQIVAPNAAALKASLTKALSDTSMREVSIRAYIILDRTGMDKFLNQAGEGARLQATDLLTQHLANNDEEGAKKFLNDLVDDVCLELKTVDPNRPGYTDKE